MLESHRHHVISALGNDEALIGCRCDSVTVVGFVGADPEQRQGRSTAGYPGWRKPPKPLFGAHISSVYFFTVSTRPLLHCKAWEKLRGSVSLQAFPTALRGKGR